MNFQEDDYIYCSWGYDQTNIDFAQIIEVSKTRKTVNGKTIVRAVQWLGNWNAVNKYLKERGFRWVSAGKQSRWEA